jgi:uncharacterized protein YqjF (DUF2071 family)
VHWQVPVEQIAPHLPPELSVDTFDGRAFVGLVPFAMEGVRPRWAPALPAVSAFLETNVRTYVHRAGRDPGVWFFSLDAASRLAVALARALFHLPYFHARMKMRAQGSEVEYRSRRARTTTKPAELDVRWVVEGAMGRAAPGTLEHFLAERYVLYSRDADGGLWLGRVHHTPYPLHHARVERLEESLLGAAGLAQETGAGDPASVLYSPGVDVEVFALERVHAR